jgi:hypothetical protein
VRWVGKGAGGSRYGERAGRTRHAGLSSVSGCLSAAIEGNVEHLVFKLLKLNALELAEGIRSYDGSAQIYDPASLEQQPLCRDAKGGGTFLTVGRIID